MNEIFNDSQVRSDDLLLEAKLRGTPKVLNTKLVLKIALSG